YGIPAPPITSWLRRQKTPGGLGHYHLAIGRCGKGRVGRIGEFQPFLVEVLQDRQTYRMAGVINKFIVGIRDIAIQREIDRTVEKAYHTATDELALIRLDNRF